MDLIRPKPDYHPRGPRPLSPGKSLKKRPTAVMGENHGTFRLHPAIGGGADAL